jgi:E3 ubiquitin-protein ligase TRIP12
VRISRRRLLDSAFKVFDLYAGPRAQLEVEFFGEVGTGERLVRPRVCCVFPTWAPGCLGLWCKVGA